MTEGVKAEKGPKITRRAFLESRAEQLPGVIPLLRAGKIWGEEGRGWENVAEHCMAQLVAAEVLKDVLALSPEDGTALVRNAAVHDWDKRLLKKGRVDFTPEEEEAVRKLFEAYGPDYGLHAATGPDFYVRAYTEGEDSLPFLERLMCYIDNITNESSFIAPEKRLRILEQSGRWPHVRNMYDHQLGGENFFDYVIGFCKRFGEQLLTRLNKGLISQGKPPIANPDDIPAWLERQVDGRVLRKSWWACAFCGHKNDSETNPRKCAKGTCKRRRGKNESSYQRKGWPKKAK